jgi:collagenase-like PrtC family protease
VRSSRATRHTPRQQAAGLQPYGRTTMRPSASGTGVSDCKISGQQKAFLCVFRVVAYFSKIRNRPVGPTSPSTRESAAQRHQTTSLSATHTR